MQVKQDTLGNYEIKYFLGDTTRIERRNQDGTVTGSYSYVDSNGVVQTVQYVAGPQGFVVLDGPNNNVDLAPQFAVPPSPWVPLVPLPEPVKDTPEVLAARAEHFALVEEAKRRIAEETHDLI